jgi:hypothetical protein
MNVFIDNLLQKVSTRSILSYITDAEILTWRCDSEIGAKDNLE